MTSAVVAEHETTIAGIQYKMKELPASEGLVIMPKLISLFGQPILKMLLSTSDAEQEEMFENKAVLAGIITQVSERAVAAEAGLLILRDLMVGVTADKVRISPDATVEGSVREHFDTHFARRYMHLVEVAMWVAKVNFIEP